MPKLRTKHSHIDIYRPIKPSDPFISDVCATNMQQPFVVHCRTHETHKLFSTEERARDAANDAWWCDGCRRDAETRRREKAVETRRKKLGIYRHKTGRKRTKAKYHA